MSENLRSAGRAADAPLRGLPTTRFSSWADALLARIGALTSWIWLLLLGVIVLNVTLRYGFSSGRIEFEELQWHLFALGFLIALSYTAQADAHIRIDVLYQHFSERTRACPP